MAVLAKLNQQLIGGVWRDGSSSKTLTDSNPFNGNTVASFRLANLKDLGEAYRSAAAAQKVWAGVNPFEKRAILEKALPGSKKRSRHHRFDHRRTQRNALQGLYRKVKLSLKEASTYPMRMKGEILPSAVDGKENRLYRVPVGVVGVISPFNFPFVLSMRSVAAAIGAGDGVVLKPHDDSPIAGGTLLAKGFEEAGGRKAC
jgi:acyl-CoA reductase-like NAD-dependent aldehyde dehydrogenase